MRIGNLKIITVTEWHRQLALISALSKEHDRLKAIEKRFNEQQVKSIKAKPTRKNGKSK